MVHSIKQSMRVGVWAALLSMLASSAALAQTPEVFVDGASECSFQTGDKFCHIGGTSTHPQVGGPFKRIGEAVNAVSPGGTLFIRGGFCYTESVLLNKAMQIRPYDGPVTILASPGLYKDFDVVGLSDANGFPLNPKWGQQVRCNALPSPSYSCPVDDSDTTHFTSSPQWPSCTSVNVKFNRSLWCGQHVNFMPVTYEGCVSWAGTAEAKFFPFGDNDYTFNVTRPDQALYSTTSGSRIHIEFDSRETVDQWDEPKAEGIQNTWWHKFHQIVDKEHEFEIRHEIDRHFVIIIGLLGMDTYQGPKHEPEEHAKTELHPVHAMFVRVGHNHPQTSWAFFVRNWGNEGYCGSDQQPNRSLIKVQIPNATRIVSPDKCPPTCMYKGARNADDTSLMSVSAEPNPAGMLLSFSLLLPKSESWIMGDVTFEGPPSLPLTDLCPPPPPGEVTAEESEGVPPQFKAQQALIDKLPESSRKELFAQQHSVVLKKPGKRLTPMIIAPSTRVGEVHLESPAKFQREAGLPPPSKDFIGELNRRKQLEVARKFFAERGVRVDLPPED
jgi:hypothetical protein